MKPVKFTNPVNGEKFIHRERKDGKVDFFYGTKDTAIEKNHGHAVFNPQGNVIYNRNPKGE